MNFIKNQEVLVKKVENGVKVINTQNDSTPGVYAAFNVIPMNYKIVVDGYAKCKGEGRCILWIADNQRNTLLLSSQNYLSNERGKNEFEFFSRYRGTVYIGILFYQSKKYDVMYLYDISLKAATEEVTTEIVEVDERDVMRKRNLQKRFDKELQEYQNRIQMVSRPQINFIEETPTVIEEVKEEPEPNEMKEEVSETESEMESKTESRNDQEGNGIVSVIIPIYNTRQYVTNAIDSILKQTYQKIEIILIDDASTESISDIVADYDGSVRYFRNERNMGTYWSINRGIMESVGEYITILGSDDRFVNNKVSIQVETLKKGYVATICQLKREGGSNKIGESTIMFKRSILDIIGYYDAVRFGGDTEYLERIIKVFGESAVYRDGRLLYLATLRNNSLTTQKGTEKNGEVRNYYVRQYRKWHTSKNRLYMPHPQARRFFKIFDLQNI